MRIYFFHSTKDPEFNNLKQHFLTTHPQDRKLQAITESANASNAIFEVLKPSVTINTILTYGKLSTQERSLKDCLGI